MSCWLAASTYALVRTSSDASKLEVKGVQIARGDMLDVFSLVAAMAGADAGDQPCGGLRPRTPKRPEINTVGNANLAKAGPFRAAGAVAGRFVPMLKDMSAMLDWFQTGRYVADTTSMREVFGAVPTAEEAVGRFASRLGHAV
jgi:hypothetical protein